MHTEALFPAFYSLLSVFLTQYPVLGQSFLNWLDNLGKHTVQDKRLQKNQWNGKGWKMKAKLLKEIYHLGKSFTETYPSKIFTSLAGVNSFPYFLKLEITWCHKINSIQNGTKFVVLFVKRIDLGIWLLCSRSMSQFFLPLLYSDHNEGGGGGGGRCCSKNRRKTTKSWSSSAGPWHKGVNWHCLDWHQLCEF